MKWDQDNKQTQKKIKIHYAQVMNEKCDHFLHMTPPHLPQNKGMEQMGSWHPLNLQQPKRKSLKY
jgi:hypothetical protein